MTEEQKKVREFHQEFSIDTKNTPTLPTRKIRELRGNLIQEELNELIEAMQEESIIKIADALGDLLYVIYGSAVSMGIDMEPIFNEIHRSNMSKKGGVLRSDGKLLKPITYSPPNLIPILEEQIYGKGK